MATKTPTRTRTARAAAGLALAFASAAGSATAYDLANWLKVFEAGNHVDSKGRECSFGTEDLDRMVANVALGKPPAVLGHPQHNDPAYGWAELKREGDALFARFDDVNPAFQAGVTSGAYRNRSVFVVNDKKHGWRVRHIGWLGAAPPAIDGLGMFTAPEIDGEAHEFSADDWTTSYALGDVARLLRGLRDWVISKDGIEVADKVLPDWSITSVQDAAARIREQAVAEAASEGDASDSTTTGLMPAFVAAGTQHAGAAMSFTQEDLNRAATEAAARATAEAEVAFAAQGSELVRLRGERQAERIGAQITGWLAAGLPPVAAEGMAEFMAAAETGALEFQFTAAGAAAPAKQAPAAWFSAWVDKLLPIVKLGSRSATPGTDPGAAAGGLTDQEVADRARAFQAAHEAKGHHISIGTAIDAVQLGKDKA